MLKVKKEEDLVDLLMLNGIKVIVIKKDQLGFIFSLDNNKIYYNKNSNCNIVCLSNYGSILGGGADFVISDNCDKNNKSYDGSGCSYDRNGD